MGPFSVRLKFEVAPATVVIPNYIMTVTALSAVNLSKKVFVYRRTTNNNNVFEGVASPDQLLTVPEDNPDPESTYPTKFRKDTVEMASAQADDLVEQKADIEEAVTRLTDSLQSAYDLSVPETVYIGVLGWAHSTNSVLGV